MFVTSIVVGIFDIAHRLRRWDDEMDGCIKEERNSDSFVCLVVVICANTSTKVSDHIICIECITSKDASSAGIDNSRRNIPIVLYGMLM